MLRVFTFALTMLLAASFTTLVGSDPVRAQGPICDKRTNVMSHLARKYSELPIALGVASNGGLVELLTSEKGSTWTLIITLPNGLTCLMAAGESWESMAKTAFGQGT